MDDETVAQFAAITSASPDRARQYLQLSDGNLEHAIQLFFESGGEDMGGTFARAPAAGAGTAASGRAVDDAIQIDSDDDGPDPADDEAVARRMQEEMYGAGAAADIDPTTGVRRPVARTAETLAAPSYGYDGDEDLNDAVRAQLLARIFNQRASGPSSVWEEPDDSQRRSHLARATGGASEATSKSSRLAELYRPPFEIMSTLVSWEGIRAQGKETEKWILLNVQDPNVFDCQILNRDIWKNPEVKDTVREHFIFKQYAKDDPQAQDYVRYYFPNVDSQEAYPHIAIVDPRTGEQVKAWSGAPVPNASEFLTQLHEFLDRYSLKANARNPVARRKADKARKEVDRMTEEEMLEMALQNSLDTDNKAPVADDPDVLTRSVPALPDAGEADEANGQATPTAFASISSAKPHSEPEATAPDTTRIQFRHPGGRVIRRFALDDPVRRIYEWLKSSPIETREGQAFDLVFMGRNLVDSLDETIAAAGLKNGSIMVEFVED